MNSQLIAISGSLQGTSFALTASEVSIGREAANTIFLNEPSVSRRHCLIKRRAPSEDQALKSGQTDTEHAEFTILDLESFNGTFVNGVPVKEQTLAHGDQIAVGDVMLLFLLHEVEAGTMAAVQLDGGDLITRSTVRLRREDALYLRPDKVLAECHKPESNPMDARSSRHSRGNDRRN